MGAVFQDAKQVWGFSCLFFFKLIKIQISILCDLQENSKNKVVFLLLIQQTTVVIVVALKQSRIVFNRPLKTL